MSEVTKRRVHASKNVFPPAWTRWVSVNEPSVTKPNPENCNNCSSKCAYDCAQLQYTLQYRTDNLPSYLQTSIIAQMLSIGGEGA